MEWNGPLRITRFLPGGVAAQEVGDREFLIFLGLTHLPLDKNGRHLGDDNFRCNFVNEKFCIFIKISPMFVSKGPIDNCQVLVLIMAWGRIGNKPLPEPIWPYWLLHICGTMGDMG